MIWAETPTNPLMKVVDIPAIVKEAKNHGDIIVVVDNTFLTPYLQKPLDFGADVSMYSLTKYMNGHSDVIMGAVVLNDDNLEKRLRFLQNGMTINLKNDVLLILIVCCQINNKDILRLTTINLHVLVK